jgi:pilus assembly protein FimV
MVKILLSHGKLTPARVHTFAHGMPFMSPNMHSSKRPKTGPFNLKTLSAAVLSALVLANAHAAGLGKLTVLSALGQPLRAEIELTSVSKDEAGNLVAKLASPDAYRQANIDPGAALSTLRFAVEQRGTRQIINVTSVQPLNEPFIDMLLELSGPSGRLVREYTFLIDPAEMRNIQPAQMASNAAPQRDIIKSAPAIAAAPASQAERPANPRATTAKPAQAAGNNASNGADAEEYKVKTGDTLGHIATRMKANGVSLDQMLVALYRTNPKAFVGENMNRLRAGQILSVPSADAAKSISNAEAREIVLAQSVDFNNYRAKLAGQVAASDPQQAAASKQSATGKITAKVEEPATPDSESKDKLKLAKAQAPAGTAAGKGSGAEDKIAQEKAAAEANSRVKELEKNVTDLQKILEVKNKGMADQQDQADAAKAAPATAAKPTEAKTEASADKAAQPSVADVAAASATSASAVTPPAKKPKIVVPPPTPASEPSFFDDLLANPYALPGLGALLVGVGALGVMSARRKKQQKNFEDSIITDSSLKANSLFGSTGGQSVDTNNSVFNSSFTPSVSQLDSNEVDPVAEADVYIAYGRDAQAEEILKEALRTQPERHAVRVKLLEIYSNRKDLRAFEVLATELYGMTKGEGGDWSQAAAMGLVMDPGNPLYASGKQIVAPAPEAEAPMADILSDAAKPAEPEPQVTEPAAVEAVEQKAESPSLDFDIGEIDFKDVEVPNTVPRPEAAEPSIDMASIDLDFLDKPTAGGAMESLAAEQKTAPVVDNPAPLEEVPALSLDIPGLPEEPVAASKADPAPLEFDLSDIKLDLPETANAKSDLAFDTSVLAETASASLSANHTEMATKLDLAVAYQEIGDKEGARELLDEVLKGGTPEQSEKAKSLLLELA